MGPGKVKCIKVGMTICTPADRLGHTDPAYTLVQRINHRGVPPEVSAKFEEIFDI